MKYVVKLGVVNPNKPNKFRIVYDVSAKSTGVSLNDCLLTGLDLTFITLYNQYNFRIKKYAFTTDIREMFLQMRLRQEDCCSQRIFRKGMNRDAVLDVYEIVVVFFSFTSGFCLAQEAKNTQELLMRLFIVIIGSSRKRRNLSRGLKVDSRNILRSITSRIHHMQLDCKDAKVLNNLEFELLAGGNKRLEVRYTFYF